MKNFMKTLCGCGGKGWVERMQKTIKEETEQDIYIADAVIEGQDVIALMVKGVVVDWVGRDYRDGINEGASSLRLVSIMQLIREQNEARRLFAEGVYAEMMRLGMIQPLQEENKATDEQVASARHIAFGKEACYE